MNGPDPGRGEVLGSRIDAKLKCWDRVKTDMLTETGREMAVLE